MNWRKFSQPMMLAVILFTVLLLTTEGIFWYFRTSDDRKVAAIISTMLREERNVIDPQILMQNLIDLKTMGVVDCILLKNEASLSPFYSSSGADQCEGHSLFRSYGTIDVRSLNGVKWTVHFIPSANITTLALLWLSRLWSAIISFVAFRLLSAQLALAESRLQIEKEKAHAMASLARQVAHDIRSPLSAINLAGSTLGNDHPKARNLIERACARINDIAIDLLKRNLDMENQNLAKKMQTSQTIDTRSVITSVVEEVQDVFSKKDIRIKIDLPPQNPLLADGSEITFSRVISNLLNNSAEAMSGAGQIEISARLESSQIVVTVADNGRGIPEAILAKLGQAPISHGKNFDESGSGSGLGVFHAINYIKSIGGKMEYSNRAPAGTLVRISLPSKGRT